MSLVAARVIITQSLLNNSVTYPFIDTLARRYREDGQIKPYVFVKGSHVTEFRFQPQYTTVPQALDIIMPVWYGMVW